MLPKFDIHKYISSRTILQDNGFSLSSNPMLIQFPFEDMKLRAAERSTPDYTHNVRHSEQLAENLSASDRFSQIKNRLIRNIRNASKEHVNFPRSQNEYVDLLWKIYDEINYFIQYTTPIVQRSQNQNIMKMLFIILHDNKEIVLKLIEFELDFADVRQYVPWSHKLIDNSIACMRVLLACCILQNLYLTVNKTLYKFSKHVFRLDTLSAFVSLVILQNIRCIREYVPNPYIFQRLHCQQCSICVTFSGCWCKNSTAPLQPTEECKINMDPLEDAPTSSSCEYMTSWDSTLQYLLSLPRPKKMSSSDCTANNNSRIARNVRQIQRPLVIRDCDERKNNPPTKSKSIEIVQNLAVKRANEDDAIDEADQPEAKKSKCED